MSLYSRGDSDDEEDDDEDDDDEDDEDDDDDGNDDDDDDDDDEEDEEEDDDYDGYKGGHVILLYNFPNVWLTCFCTFVLYCYQVIRIINKNNNINKKK